MIEPGTIAVVQRNVTVRHIDAPPPARVLFVNEGETVVVVGYPNRPDMPVEVSLIERSDDAPPNVYMPRDAIA
jgi:hypothetical protein